MRRIPACDFSTPSQRESEQDDGVVDERPHAHVDGQWGADAEPQFRRRDLAEILGGREEGKYRGDRMCDPRRLLDEVFLHEMLPRKDSGSRARMRSLRARESAASRSN